MTILQWCLSLKLMNINNLSAGNRGGVPLRNDVGGQLPVDGDSREGKNDTAPDRSAKDAGWLEDADQ
jgi:hypothetical protein